MISSSFIKGVISLVVLLVCVWVSSIALLMGMTKQDKVWCYKWQKYEKEFEQFEASEEEADVCESLGIKIK